MISIALAFLIGVLALLQLRSLPDAHLAWLLLPAIIIILFNRNQWFRLSAACLAGFLWCLFISHQVLVQGLPAGLEGQDVLVTGRVENFPARNRLATRFLFRVEEMQYKGWSYPSPGMIRLSWYSARVKPLVGERWQFLVRLKPPHGFMNPGGTDYEAWLFQHRIRATGYVRTQVTPRRLAGASDLFLWQRLRYSMQVKIKKWVTNPNMAGLLTALAIGERDGIHTLQWEVLRRTGTAHLMAISGLHIGLLASLGYGLGLWLWRLRSGWLKRLPAQKTAAVVAMLFALTYAALAGFSIPTQRALIMVCVVMLAILRQRFVQPSQVLAQSLLLVLLLDPLSALSAGFWLSFAAVAVIAYGLSGRLGRACKWRSLLKMQWVVVLGLLPLSLGLFQQASLVSPLANLLAIPVVSFLVVPLTLLACVLMFVYAPLAGGLLHLAASLMQVLWQALEFVSQWSFSQVQLAVTPLALALATLGVVLLISPKGIPLRSLGLIFCLPLVFPLSPRPDKGHIWLSLLDVGQGLAVVVQTRRHTLVYDTGPKFSDSFDTGASVVAPYLRHAGISKIDMLMISHGDNDHIGGAASLLRMFPVDKILSSVPKRVSPRAKHCEQGQHWQWDGVQFSVIHPQDKHAPRQRRRNNRCCVLRIAANDGSVLLTGDIETAAERQILASTQLLNSDVLVVPHHGSKTSSSRAFIKAVAPKLALYPVGYRNRYHFPSQKVVQRYARMLIPTYATADSGCLSLTFDARHSPKVVRYRQQMARFWQHRLP